MICLVRKTPLVPPYRNGINLCGWCFLLEYFTLLWPHLQKKGVFHSSQSCCEYFSEELRCRGVPNAKLNALCLWLTGNSSVGDYLLPLMLVHLSQSAVVESFNLWTFSQLYQILRLCWWLAFVTPLFRLRYGWVFIMS